MDDFARGEFFGGLAEGFEVGEEDGGVAEVDGFDEAVGAEFVGDLLGEDAVEEADVFGEGILEDAFEVVVHGRLEGAALFEDEEVGGFADVGEVLQTTSRMSSRMLLSELRKKETVKPCFS